MFRTLERLLTFCLFVKALLCQDIDFNLCPNGLTTSPSDFHWPKLLPTRFELHAEISTDVESFEVTQFFSSGSGDSVTFHNYELDEQTYYDFHTNELFVINSEQECDRSEMRSDEHFPFIASHIVKPSILFGFDGRNNLTQTFFTRYLGNATIRDGIETLKFQSCFYLVEDNLTINATYYLSTSFSNLARTNIAPEFVQIDVLSSVYPYTYNIIRFESTPSLSIVTPSGAFCPNRTNTKGIPQNLPAQLSLHAEGYTLPSDTNRSRIESYKRLIDETLQIERTDYSMGQTMSPPAPSASFMDYVYSLSYLYTRETQQCLVLNISQSSIGTTNELLFQFGTTDKSLSFHYTGIADCGRERIQCHRWIGQRDLGTFVQQYEWFWAAKDNQLDLQALIPIKIHLKTIFKSGTAKAINQQIYLFHYDPQPNVMEEIDTTLGECYRALGPRHNFNYAILRLTLNNDAKMPIYRHLLSLERQLHRQIASDLNIRHVRLSSFIVDTTRDTTNQQDKDVVVTFTLLDNPPSALHSARELSLIECIERLARLVNGGQFRVRDTHGAYELEARPNTVQTLGLYFLPLINQTNYVNRTVEIEQNVTQTVIRKTQKLVYQHTGPKIAALWTGFTLLGLVVALAVGSFVAIRTWKPIVVQE